MTDTRKPEVQLPNASDPVIDAIAAMARDVYSEVATVAGRSVAVRRPEAKSNLPRTGMAYESKVMFSRDEFRMLWSLKGVLAHRARGLVGKILETLLDHGWCWRRMVAPSSHDPRAIEVIVENVEGIGMRIELSDDRKAGAIDLRFSYLLLG